MEAPWLEEALSRPSNKARKGDADYGVKPYNEAAEKRKKEREKKSRGSGRFDESKVKRGAGEKGGQFVSKGDTGHMVGTVQDKLGVEHTGVYDAGTAASVVAFQKRHGLVADGIVGRQTALALTGQYDRARRAGPGALGPETSKLVGGDSRDGSRRRRSRRRASRRPSGERVRGGAVIAQLIEDDASPLGVAEDVVDRLGNVHDALGKFTLKLGKKGKGHPAAVIPEYDPSQLTFGKSAGGSNGARIATHRDGSKWLVKAYQGNENRVATELLSNAVYREVGARVPRAGRIQLHNGKKALAYPLLEGKPRPLIFQRRGGRPSEAVGKHFMTDALLANWDLAGMDDDNILWDPQGHPFRVDQGGTLEFRAMGGRKEFGPVPYEVTTMLRPGAQGRRAAFVTGTGLIEQAKQISATLTPQRVDQLVDGAGFKDAKMRERVRKALKARVAWMGRFSRGEVGMPVPPAPKVLEAAWLPPLEEAALPYAWKEALHPRDQHGKFVEKIGGLPGGKAIQLDAKTTIKKDKDGTFRVVRSGGIIKGFRTPEDAARAALDRSAKGKDADSVGGSVSFKDYNAYLQARGFNPNQPDAFGGKQVSGVPELANAENKLKLALSIAQQSDDKYVQRQIPTLKARLAEAQAKIKALGGTPAAGVADPVAFAAKAGTPTIAAPATSSNIKVGDWVHNPATGKNFKVESLGNIGYTVTNEKGEKVGPLMAYGGVMMTGKAPAKTGTSSAPAAGRLEALLTPEKVLPVGTQFEVKKTPGLVFEVTGKNESGEMTAKVVKGTTNSGQGVGHTASWGPENVEAYAKDGWTLIKAPKAGKPIKGMQDAPKVGSYAGTYGTLKPASAIPAAADLDLAVGDVIQQKKGGWKHTVTKVHEKGVTAVGPNGQSKFWGDYKKVAFVQKADGSAVKLKEKGEAGTPTSGSGAPEIAQMALNPDTIKNKLSTPDAGSTLKIGTLKDGDVIQTPDGKVGVLKPGEPAYSGYVTAYDIKTGQKFEPPADKPPFKFTTDPTVKAAAAAALVKAQSGTKVTTSGGQSGTTGASPAAPQVGPPPAFQGVASWYAAKTYVPTADEVGLTSAERSAITSYTGSGYGDINAALRNSESVKSLSIGKKAAAIKSALAKSKVKQDVWIGRRTTNGIWKSAAQAGSVIGDNGVLSTSYDENSWSGDIHLNILVKKGHPALNVESISNHPGEKEILLAPGSLFHVLKREQKGSQTVLYVEMI